MAIIVMRVGPESYSPSPSSIELSVTLTDKGQRGASSHGTGTRGFPPSVSQAR